MTDEAGYDLSFVSEVPDYLQCLVCHLVLRDPVLVIACGHKFCRPCFRQLEARAASLHVSFRCPVDEDVVDLNKVCADLGLTRVIGCLVVGCDSHARGCPWEGELSELPTHLKKCEFAPPPNHAEVAADIKKLKGRLDEAAKNIAEQRNEIKELKEKDLEKSRKLEEFENRNLKLKEDMEKLKQLQEEKETKLFEEMALIRREVVLLKRAATTRTTTIRTAAATIAAAATATAKPANEKQKRDDINASKGLIKLQLCRGSASHVNINLDNVVHFKSSVTTVAAPDALVVMGHKVVYEVELRWGWTGFVGWADKKFIGNGGLHVGGCKNSWAFRGDKWHNNNFTRWGKGCEQDGRPHILGVALDMERGDMLFGWDGVWDPPMGVAFNVDTQLQLFPAISGADFYLHVNFGDKPLSFGGPDNSYIPIAEL